MDATTQLANRRSFPHSASAVPVRLVRAAFLPPILPVVILGICFHAALSVADHGRRPVFLTKVLFCVLAPFVGALSLECSPAA